MSAEILVRKFFDAYNSGDAEAMESMFAPDAVVEYVGAGVKAAVFRGRTEIDKLFKKMVSGAKKRLERGHSCPSSIFARDDMAAIEWSTTVADKDSGAPVITRGVNVCEIEDGKFRKMTVYLPVTADQPFSAASKLAIQDLGELSLIAWAIV